jgi:hypothetical protein
LRHLYISASFYQDRLGTNIGKALKKEWRFLRGVRVAQQREEYIAAIR